MTEPDEHADEGEYGDRPLHVLRAELYRRPALIAVAVEFFFILVLGNQWIFDHVVTPWSISVSPVRRGLAGAIGWFSWLLAPQHGLTWVWLAGLLHVVAWLGGTYLLARAGVRGTDALARFVSVTGAVMVAAVFALLVTRLVSYPDVSNLYAGGAEVGISAPGFVEWVFLDTVAGGSILAVTVVALLAASAVGAFVLDEIDETNATNPGGLPPESDRAAETSAPTRERDQADEPGAATG